MTRKNNSVVVALPHTSKDLVQIILGMAPEDQTKFLDVLDRVCQGSTL